MKGFFTQGAALLTNGPIGADSVSDLLQTFGEIRPSAPSAEWAIGGNGFIVPLRPQVNGFVAVDIVQRPWPDDMGHPQTAPMLFGAWSTGHFGPFAYPRGFQRACEHAWRWPEVRRAPPVHDGFIRIKSSYCFGSRPQDPVFPADYEARSELVAVTRIVEALAAHPAVVAFFNPNGEVLLPGQALCEALAWSREHDLPPLEVWSNIRFFNLGGVADGWFLLDTVGMWQLDVPDHEAFVPAERYDFSEVDNFLRNASLYVMQNGQVIKDGDTMDGPGRVRWQAKTCDSSYSDPPREVLRWLPLDGSPVPRSISEARQSEKRS